MVGRLAHAAAVLAAATALGGCAASATPADDGRMQVSASFYPLQWASERVGGGLVDVTGLTPPGGEPHDLELTPKAVGRLTRADVVVYLAGFQPAVDDAVTQEAATAAFDVSQVAGLDLAATPDGHDHSGESATDHAEHGGGTGVADPHFWLDPVRFAHVATALGERFAAADPSQAHTYRANAATLVADLESLDARYRTGLAHCAQDQLVTAHSAFAYLADRYGLHQDGIAGISPDVEPDAATLRRLADLVRRDGVSTVYTETLASPALAETVARETGARVAVLDPVEGLTDASAGRDYLQVMAHNLETLRAGQQCR
jgi:zinc transport system substrate-binding protein